MNIPLSTTQKTALAIVLAAPTPTVALGQLQYSSNLRAAAEQLVKLQLITNMDQPELTAVGIAAADEEGVTVDGVISSYGEQLLSVVNETITFPLISELLHE